MSLNCPCKSLAKGLSVQLCLSHWHTNLFPKVKDSQCPHSPPHPPLNHCIPYLTVFSDYLLAQN